MKVEDVLGIEMGTPVLVATEDRGVYAGEFVEERENGDVVLANLRMCVYWPSEVRGLVGLAANGPNEDSRITPPGVRGLVGLAANGPNEDSRITPSVPKGLLKGVVAVLEMTPEAAQAWEAEPWG